MSYSVFNNYDYEKKSSILKVLDTLARPCSIVFGGRKISVISQTQQNVSTATRVSAAVFSIIIFPVGFLSASCLIIKAASLPWIWQKKEVKAQSQQTWDIILQFRAAHAHDEAIKIFKKRPEIGKRADIYVRLHTIIRQKIASNCSLEDIEESLQLLNYKDAFSLMNDAIKTRLSYEFQRDCHITTGNSIIGLIHKTIGRNAKNFEECCDRLFANVLKIHADEDLVVQMIKLDITHCLVEQLFQKKKSCAQSELDEALVSLERTIFNTKLFREADTWNLASLFSNSEQMSQIRGTVTDIRALNKSRIDFFNEIKMSRENPREQWEHVRSKFQLQLDDVFAPMMESYKEKEFLSSFATLCTNMSEYIDSLQLSGTSFSKEDIEIFQAKIDNGITKFGENSNDLFQNLRIEDSKTVFDTILSTLYVKRNYILLSFTFAMKDVLMKMMEEAVKANQQLSSQS